MGLGVGAAKKRTSSSSSSIEHEIYPKRVTRVQPTRLNEPPKPESSDSNTGVESDEIQIIDEIIDITKEPQVTVLDSDNNNRPRIIEIRHQLGHPEEIFSIVQYSSAYRRFSQLEKNTVLSNLHKWNVAGNGMDEGSKTDETCQVVEEVTINNIGENTTEASSSNKIPEQELDNNTVPPNLRKWNSSVANVMDEGPKTGGTYQATEEATINNMGETTTEASSSNEIPEEKRIQELDTNTVPPNLHEQDISCTNGTDECSKTGETCQVAEEATINNTEETNEASSSNKIPEERHIQVEEISTSTNITNTKCIQLEEAATSSLINGDRIDLTNQNVVDSNDPLHSIATNFDSVDNLSPIATNSDKNGIFPIISDVRSLFYNEKINDDEEKLEDETIANENRIEDETISDKEKIAADVMDLNEKMPLRRCDIIRFPTNNSIFKFKPKDIRIMTLKLIGFK